MVRDEAIEKFRLMFMLYQHEIDTPKNKNIKRNKREDEIEAIGKYRNDPIFKYKIDYLLNNSIKIMDEYKPPR